MIRLPLVALIDVVLFVLMFFVASSDLTQDEAELASALRGDAAGKGNSAVLPQIVSVETGEKDAVYKLGDRVFSSRDTLAAVLRQLPKENGVFIRVRGDVLVDAAAAALQAAQDAGFTRISYVPAS
jgi:biopolymer transport protein ExbD